MFKRRSFGCGSLIFVIVVTVAVIAVGAYFAFESFVSPYLNNAEIQELYSIYMDLSQDVNEADIVTNPPLETDYDNAQTKLSDGGIEIFNEYNDIDPTQLENANFVPTADITLSDTELAAFVNAFLENPLNLEALGIDAEQVGGLNTEILEISIETIDSINVNLSIIVKLDLEEIQTQLGFFGIFLPDFIYIQNNNTLQLVEGEYELISGDIVVNDLSEEQNDRMFEILVEALQSEEDPLTLEELKLAVGEIMLEGIQEASNTFNTDITFNNGSITFSPTA
jgi:hypothetical protein